LPRVFSSPSIEARARSPQPVSLRRESRGSNDPRLSRSRFTPSTRSTPKFPGRAPGSVDRAPDRVCSRA